MYPPLNFQTPQIMERLIPAGRRSEHLRLGKIASPDTIGGGILKGGRLVKSPPLSGILFVLFLPKQEKDKIPFGVSEKERTFYETLSG